MGDTSNELVLINQLAVLFGASNTVQFVDVLICVGEPEREYDN